MGGGPAPFSEIGKRARDLLTKDYNYNQKFSLTIPSSTGMGLTAIGVKKDNIFVGDISSQYKSGNTAVDVKVDTYSNVITKVTITDLLPSTKAAVSFSIPDQKSGKLVVDYARDGSAINSSIGLNPTPLLELAAAIGFSDVAFGGEIGFDTASSSFTKYNAGISFNKPDFSAALILTDKGQTLKGSYIHLVNPLSGTMVAAEMTHRFSTFENGFCIGSVHKVDPVTIVKTRFANNGKVALLGQREWRHNSLLTVSADERGLNIRDHPPEDRENQAIHDLL
ncbi:unnamed protein product [Fraxinus pennsylvanica]|uniref:Voltage-dependent anion-selective channel protein n=1 Tax=Fraxinus pennsylvanica TaxID=56036 RepID=A0AAD2DRJ6_9LAMI|nr:unnamed protein product [Fraxinus pennsylvanica]